MGTPRIEPGNKPNVLSTPRIWFDNRVVIPTSWTRAPSKARARWEPNDPVAAQTDTSRAHELRQSLRIVRVGLVDLHLERRPRMPGVKACDFEPPAAQFVHQPWRHGTGLDADTRILLGMPTYHPLDLFGV